MAGGKAPIGQDWSARRPIEHFENPRRPEDKLVGALLGRPRRDLHVTHVTDLAGLEADVSNEIVDVHI
jgi:hypothetical protein